ncbi:hybrid sensor histidine kinase/response regulator [Pokkaliibacter plantistimulans]|uniref:Sensory/regulatory protein RpfC n=1 Tax=Proteobacteria bacterium 228 TaxID=2083153 RepID=A0A2S5KUW5_9PROT|nr:CHASE domain-containing protein [Pokkaliibacter plantistimulans]PPC78661.1 hybrid sensor histidine kinase/response regulator [Pokkaliibacter plantistimulans]
MKWHNARGLMTKAVGLSFCIGLLLSTLLVLEVRENNAERLDRAVEELGANMVEQVLERVHLYEYGLSATRSIVLTTGGQGLNRELYHRYIGTRDFSGEFPGARGFGVIRRVPADTLNEFIAQARQDNWPDFAVRELSANTDTRYVIQYIEPVQPNIQAVGLDIASERNRKAAADKALATGEVQLTGPITLVQATGSPLQSFLILMPIYRDPATPATEAERLSKAWGWSYAPLLVTDVLAGLELDPDKLHLELFDVTDVSKQERFYSSDNLDVSDTHPWQRRHEVFGRQWEVQLSVRPAFIAGLHLPSPWSAGSVSLGLSALLSALLGVVSLNRKNRERTIEDQARMAAIVANSADAIIGNTLEGVVTSWNRGAELIFGYAAEEAVGRLLVDLIVPKERRKEERDILNSIARGRVVPNFETRRQRKDGTQVDVAVTVAPIADATGKVVGASKTLRDITSQKEAERRIHELNAWLEHEVDVRTVELQAARDQLLMAASIARLGIWSWFPVDNRLEWNAKMFELYAQPLALNEAGLSYIHWRERIHPDDLARTEQALQSAIKGTGEFDVIHRLLLPEGDIRFVQASTFIERDSNGNALKLTGIYRDITSEQELEDWLRCAKEQADQASSAKSSFLANMSHEIRTPMNAVLGMLELVRQTDMTAKQQDYVNKAQIAGRSLLGLLNDILDYSKIGAGKLELDPQPFDLEALLQELAVVLTGLLHKPDVELMFDIDPYFPASLIGDSLRLQQVLTNLASNAVKFTEHGQVVIRVRHEMTQSQCLRLLVEVEDSGIGISPEQQERIFEGFTQAEASISRRFGGTGLGLVISRHLIQMMGGTLQLESELGKGSRFWFDVELAVPAGTPLAMNKPATARQILLIEDNPISRQVLAAMLQRVGWQVTEAACGNDGVAAARLTLEQGGDFDAVLLDWYLPDLDGVAVGHALNALPWTDKKPHILMITAYGQEHLNSVMSLPNTPFVDYLSKPVTPLQLVSTIDQAISGGKATPQRPAFVRNPRLTGVRILIVEDNAFNRQVAAELLMNEGAEIRLAVDGQQGIDAVHEYADQLDVVLMDVQMPRVDGLEATRQLRADGRFSGLPIIAMTANASGSDREACLAAGMNAHLGKPLDIEAMVSTISTMVAGRAAKPVWTETSAKPRLVLIDESEDPILSRFGGMGDLYLSLLPGFRQNSAELLQKLRNYVAEKQTDDIKAVLHTLKGSSGTMGAMLFAARMAELEKEFRNTESRFRLTTAAIDQLQDELAQELEQLQQLAARYVTTNDTDQQEGQWTEEEWRIQLRSLLELLDTSNMRALEQIDMFPLGQITGQESRIQINEALQRVRDLDFSAASRLISAVLEAM